MGIWHEAVILCGLEIEIKKKLLYNLQKYDPNFEIKFTDNINHKRENGEIYRYKDSEGMRLNDIVSVLNGWLKIHFPGVVIRDKCPIYDCSYLKRKYFLCLDLSISEIDKKSSIVEVITALNGIDLSNYQKVFAVLYPNKEYEEPKIFAVPYIW